MAVLHASPLRHDMTTARSVATDDLGKLLLRVTIGVLLLLHGIPKIFTGPGHIVDMLTAHNLPGALAWLVYVGEVLAPVLLIVGVWTRLAAIVAAINMVVAIALASADKIFALGKFGGWAIEVEGLFLFGALAVALLGAGRYSVGGITGRFN